MIMCLHNERVVLVVCCFCVINTLYNYTVYCTSKVGIVSTCIH